MPFGCYEWTFGFINPLFNVAVTLRANHRLPLVWRDIVRPFFIGNHKELGPQRAALGANHGIENKRDSAFRVQDRLPFLRLLPRQSMFVCFKRKIRRRSIIFFGVEETNLLIAAIATNQLLPTKRAIFHVTSEDVEFAFSCTAIAAYCPFATMVMLALSHDAYFSAPSLYHDPTSHASKIRAKFLYLFTDVCKVGRGSAKFGLPLEVYGTLRGVFFDVDHLQPFRLQSRFDTLQTFEHLH